MNTCKTCKYWSTEKEKNSPHRFCENCGIFDEDGRDSLWPISIQDGIGITTGPDFGCLHWERKEK